MCFLTCMCVIGLYLPQTGPPLPTRPNTYQWLQVAGSAQHSVSNRIPLPPGFIREKAAPASFAAWLRNLPLKPGRPPVKLFNGQDKRNQAAHAAVFDIDVGDTDLQQCADAVMRLRAEYLYSLGLAAGNDFHGLHFNFTSGFRADYAKWAAGYRIHVSGNDCSWVKTEKPDTSYPTFRKYLNQVFTFAGTASLSRELVPVANIRDLHAGDVFIQGGFPGHAVIVVDTAIHPRTKQKVFLLAQSYMPAQDIQLLRNPTQTGLSPWYPAEFGETLVTPEWTFKRTDLKRFG